LREPFPNYPRRFHLPTGLVCPTVPAIPCGWSSKPVRAWYASSMPTSRHGFSVRSGHPYALAAVRSSRLAVLPGGFGW